MAGGLWAVFVGFRLIYRYRCRLSKCSCFGSVTIIIVIDIIYRLFFAVIVPKLVEFRYPRLLLNERGLFCTNASVVFFFLFKVYLCSFSFSTLIPVYFYSIQPLCATG